MNDGDALDVTVVGQTPPPFGGQAVMFSRLLQHSFPGVNLHHVRLNYSRQIDQAGRFQVGKVFHLLSVVSRVTWSRLRNGGDVLYYPPAGGQAIPTIRDIATLVATRWMFKRTMFHFHAVGLGEAYRRAGAFYRWLLRRAYFDPDMALIVSEYNEDDAREIHARSITVVPNCYPVDSLGFDDRQVQPGRLLFVGLLTPNKGVEELIEAVGLLQEWGVTTTCVLVGRAESPDYAERLRSRVAALQLEGVIEFAGEVVGDGLSAEYARADVFVFPTRGRSESFGLVLLEAMARGVPAVASGQGGVRSIVRSGVNGFLVDSCDPVGVADAVRTVVENRQLRTALGRHARAIVAEEYSPDSFYARMTECFDSMRG